MTSTNLTLKEILHFLDKNNPLLADKLYNILNSLMTGNSSHVDLISHLEKFNSTIDKEYDRLHIDRSKNRSEMQMYLSIQIAIDDYLKNLTSLTQTQNQEKQEKAVEPIDTPPSNPPQFTKPIVYLSNQVEYCPHCKRRLQAKTKIVTFMKNGELHYQKLPFHICEFCNEQYFQENLFNVFVQNKDCSTMNFKFEEVIADIVPVTHQKIPKETTITIDANNLSTTNADLTLDETKHVEENVEEKTDPQFLSERAKIIKGIGNDEFSYSLDTSNREYFDEELLNFYIYDDNIFKKYDCHRWDNRWIELLYRFLTYFYHRFPLSFKTLPEELADKDGDTPKFKLSFDYKVLENPIALPFRVNNLPIYLEADLSTDAIVNVIRFILNKHNIPQKYLLIIAKKRQ